MRDGRLHVVVTMVVVLIAFLTLSGCGGKNKPSTPVADPTAGSTTAPDAGTEAGIPPPPPPASGDGSTPGETAAQETAPPPLPELDDVRFEFDRYSLTAESRRILARNARMLESRPEMRVTIEGHCDERGTIEYNLALGEKRAAAVKDYLIKYGIAPGRLSTVSFGEERPIDPRATEEAWAANRRAHLRGR